MADDNARAPNTNKKEGDLSYTGVPMGDFPFPLTDSPKETRYLTWIRNHSNYMAAQGLLDYVRALAILVRGVVINLLVWVPLLVVIASLVFIVEINKVEGEDYFLTKVALGIALTWIVLPLLLTPLFQFIRARKRLETGSDSSVKLRDVYEKSFAFVLLLVVSAAALETLPKLVDYKAVYAQIDWRQLVIALGALSASGKLLSMVSGVARQIAAVVIGLIGFLLPLFIVLMISEFMKVQEPSEQLGILVDFASAAAVLVIVTQVVSLIWSQPSFILRMLTILIVSLAVFTLFFIEETLNAVLSPLGEFENMGSLVLLSFYSFVFCWAVVDVNLTSIHGLYRDRLAAAFLVGEDTEGDVDIEEDLDLAEICRHEAGSRAPYHLINAALNLQGSKAMEIRDRNSDFFIFSKNFIGGERTGYCHSDTLERVFPQMGLSTAMAVSAAAAAPNMGRNTSPALVFLMAILNIRLGYWMPNPGRLEDSINGEPWRKKKKKGIPPGISFEGENGVFSSELVEIQRRWQQLPGRSSARSLSMEAQNYKPTVKHNLVGLAFSGGGIRSATLNLGIAQALNQSGVFEHVDYLSTVSGGGYLGSSLSALMRRSRRTDSPVHGEVDLKKDNSGRMIMTINELPPPFWKRWLLKLQGKPEPEAKVSEFVYENYAEVLVSHGDTVIPGQRLLNTRSFDAGGSAFERFNWRATPISFLREMFGWLNEHNRLVNVSDGGHIENLATFELLRRRCRYIIIGDAEADPEHRFNGLATLIRIARIDLGVQIDIKVNALRLDPETNTSKAHWAIGKIHYPGESTDGYLLYLKSSVTGDEDVVIQEYRRGDSSFPHESTADQFFGEGQFEAYRSLGQHIAEQALEHAGSSAEEQQPMTFTDLDNWFQSLVKKFETINQEVE